LASGPHTVPSRRFLIAFSNLAQTYSYATDYYSYAKCEMQREDILTFLNVLGEYFISHEKRGHVLQKEDIWQPVV